MNPDIAYLPPLERMAVSLYAVNLLALDDPSRLKPLVHLWTSDKAPQKAMWVRMAELVTKTAGVQPELLRWCDGPDCLASFDASTGPTEKGWRQNRYVLACPTHAALDHFPSYRWEGEIHHARCTCGKTTELHAAVGDTLAQWWQQHIRDITKGGA